MDETGDIMFLSNRDGYRNMYRYVSDSAKIYQMTDLVTGISGITHYSPAISVARKRDRILYTLYEDSKYSIYRAQKGQFLSKEVQQHDNDFAAASLPKVNQRAPALVDRQIESLDMISSADQDNFKDVKYRPKFKLDFLSGSAGAGVGTSSSLGTQEVLAGGVSMFFSDILGNHQIYTGLSLNGEIYDIAGVLQYTNQSGRIAWGAFFSHIPYRTGRFISQRFVNLQTNQGTIEALEEQFDIIRIFEDQLGVFAHYPLSRTQRFEVGASANYYSQRIDRYTNYYRAGGGFVDYGFLIGQEREKQDAPDAFKFAKVNTAYVGDNSFFGMTSPMKGQRYRLGLEKFFGDADFSGVLADYRKYFFVKPFSFAFRGVHYARFNNFFELGDTESALEQFPLYIIQPYYVRGYNSFSSTELNDRFGLRINELTGSKLLMGNFEFRIPFTGPRRLALIPSSFLFSDLALFFDSGIAFDEYDQLGKRYDEMFDQPEFIMSAGVSLRVNLFGALILEPFYAWPLRENTKAVFGLNLLPGW